MFSCWLFFCFAAGLGVSADFGRDESLLHQLPAGLRMMTVFEVIVVVAFAPKDDGATTVLLVSVEPKYLPQQTVPIALNEVGERPIFVLPLGVMVPFEVVAIHIAAATGVASHDFFEPLQPGGIG